MPGVNTKIIASDYNSIRSKVVSVLGTGSGDSGYGQNVSSIDVAVNAKITVTQWNNLRNDLLRCRQHQTGLDESGGLTLATSTTTIRESDRAAYMSMADTVTSNRLVTPPSGQASIEAVTTQQRTSNWNGTLTHIATVTFASAEDMRYFFNSGSQLLISADRAGGANTTKDQSWSNLLGTNLVTYPNGMGVIKFNHNSTTCTGTGITSAIGYRQLTTSNQQIFQKNASSYLPNKYYINARLNGSNQIIFSISFEDSAGSGNQVLPQFGIDEDITGTLTSTVQAYRASGGNVNVLLPGGSSSGL